MLDMEPEQLARMFHETYERIAPRYGYETRDESRTTWEEVPDENKQLMIHTCQEVIKKLKEMKPLLIYVAGPYTAPTEVRRLSNVTAAIDAGIGIIERGHVPIVPHLNHYIDRQAKSSGLYVSWIGWVGMGMHVIDVCDALLYLAPSRGADIELAHAKSELVPIYTSVKDIPHL